MSPVIVLNYIQYYIAQFLSIRRTIFHFTLEELKYRLRQNRHHHHPFSFA